MHKLEQKVLQWNTTPLFKVNIAIGTRSFEGGAKKCLAYTTHTI